MNPPLKVLPFQKEYASDFARLNYEWLHEYFTVEPHDTEMLENPEQYIIQHGGQIFFAQIGDQNVGTVAMIHEGNGVFELAKMAVSNAHRGSGIGKVLIQSAIAFANQNHAQLMYLVSNSRLKPALHLYEKFGFVHKSMCADTPYQRCDVRMELSFD